MAGWAIQVQVIALVARWLPVQVLVFVADSSFAVFVLLDQVSRLKKVSLITRLRMDAQLYDFAPERKPGQKGRPRIKGARRPSPERRLEDPQTKWEKLEIEDWYGGGNRQVEVFSETYLWGTTGRPYAPIRWVLVRDVLEQFKPCAFLSTEFTHAPRQILTWFVRRWRMEVSFEESAPTTICRLDALAINDSGGRLRWAGKSLARKIGSKTWQKSSTSQKNR